MKKSILYTLMASIAIMISLPMSAQLDRTKAPEAGPAPKIEFGNYEKFTMKNGLKVIVVEDHDQPMVTAHIAFFADPTFEGEKAGVSNLFGDLWSKGTVSRNAEELHKAIDFTGSSLSTGSNYITFTSLTRYCDDMMNIMSDIIMNPAFPQDEMDKIKTQGRSALELGKTEPSSILDNIKTATVYPEAHPYSDIMTLETLDAITVDDCRDYYEYKIKPNDAVMVFIGDINVKEAKKLTKKYLKNWEEGEKTRKQFEKVVAPEGINVVFSPKDGSVQSSISMMSPIEIKHGAPDILAANMANFIYGGGGFTAKLMMNLREDKGYTYGAYSRISPDEISASFAASAEVNSNATDSSFIEMKKELVAMQNGDFADIDLERAKKAYAGSFSRSLESSMTLANFAINTERYNLPADYYATYLQRLDAVTREDVMAAVKKYMDPDNCYYFVVGDESVLEGLKKLDSDGVIVELDYKGDPIEKKAVSADVTVDKVYEKYINAIGGRELLEGIEDMTEENSMSVMGMEMITKTARIPAQNAMSITQSMSGNVISSIILCDGKLSISAQGMNQEITDADQISAVIGDMSAFPELDGADEAVIAGIEEIEGKDAYKVKIEKNNIVTYNFYDVESGYKVKSVTSAMGQTQEVTFSDYQKTEYGITYPMLQKTTLPQLGAVDIKVISLGINQGLTPEQL